MMQYEISLHLKQSVLAEIFCNHTPYTANLGTNYTEQRRNTSPPNPEKKVGIRRQKSETFVNPKYSKRLWKKLRDRVIIDVNGPAELFETLTGKSIITDELNASISLTAQFPEYQFFTKLSPILKKDGTTRFITPEETGETGKIIEEATGSKKHPYDWRPFDPATTSNKKFESLEPLPASALFKYRTADRRYMVLTEITK